MPHRVVNLAEWRDRDSAALLAYLNGQLQSGDLGGLMVQSISRDGKKERVYMTGIYDQDKEKALGAALHLSVMITAATGDFQDPRFD